MSEAQMTLTGYVGTDVDYRAGRDGAPPRARFRVACTPRFFDRQQGAWRDQETVWKTVKVWRALAANVASSVRKGEPVVIVGRVRAEVWKDEDGELRSDEVLEATSVGHDLNRGTSAFLRRPVAPAEQTDRSEQAAPETRDGGQPGAIGAGLTA